MRYIDLTQLAQKRESWGNKKNLWEQNPTLKMDFESIVGKKCWYSEACLNMSDCDIDHFRPKKAVKKFENYDYNKPLTSTGYNWLKDDYENYRLASRFSNRKTGQGGKNDYFPLLSNVYRTKDGNESEEPVLLDPCDKNDVNLLTFFCGDVNPVNPQCTINCKRVDASKKIYNLIHTEATQERISVWNQVEEFISQYDQHKIVSILQKNLSSLICKKSAYSACAIAAVNSLLAGRDDLLDELALDLEL